MSDILSIRVPKDVKERLRKYKDFNWRSYIVEMIERKLRELELREIIEKIDELNRDLEQSKVDRWKMIREDRNARSGL